MPDPAALLAPEGLREGLEGWLGENAVMKRTFRDAATVAGLIEKNLPGLRKTGRQATFSSDILYDTLRKYDPGHLMLRITRAEAGRGLVDFGRIEEMLARSRRPHRRGSRAPHVTPLAAPLLLEMGRVPIRGRAEARLVARGRRRPARRGRPRALRPPPCLPRTRLLSGRAGETPWRKAAGRIARRGGRSVRCARSGRFSRPTAPWSWARSAR